MAHRPPSLVSRNGHGVRVSSHHSRLVGLPVSTWAARPSRRPSRTLGARAWRSWSAMTRTSGMEVLTRVWQQKAQPGRQATSLGMARALACCAKFCMAWLSAGRPKPVSSIFRSISARARPRCSSSITRAFSAAAMRSCDGSDDMRSP